MSRSIETAVLVDDHALLRAGLRSALEADAGISVVAEADDCAAARRHLAATPPDLLVVDQSLPDGFGTDLAREVRRARPHMAIILVTGLQHGLLVAQAQDAGIAGVVAKGDGAPAVLAAVAALRLGRSWTSPGLAELHARGSAFHALTRRERDVLHWLLEGDGNAEVAARLNVSVKTVETHRMHLMQKLDVHSLGQLFRKAREAGLLQSG